ncbi:MAG: amidohydrolase [SAR324 cluster bacterium]|nr:amidohydrolase [SAR324 cluster bacterium]
MIESNSTAHRDMVEWRRNLHQYPETAFAEFLTSDFIAEKLTEFGLTVQRGLAKTGVVATLKAGNGRHAIGLRADMDALFLEEKNEFAHKSRHQGKMHACGHDGHCGMLLGAAKYLSKIKKFDGTVHFIFQPAEENESGGRVMVEEGLFEQFPMEGVYGMHNWPGMPVGKMGVRSGPMMAASDYFRIVVQGKGGHAAIPQLSVDPVVVAAQIVTALQTITSRNADPLDAAVVSVTQIHGGSTGNVIPNEVILQGTARAFQTEVQDMIEERISHIAESISSGFGAKTDVHYKRCYPPTINHESEAELAVTAAAKVVGESNVIQQLQPSMGAEDFAFMLQKKPGCYVWIGNGMVEGGCMLHNANYDFNDDILPIGANYWIKLVETALS